MTRFDVVVEGAGPAGATAAYYLAKQGRSVALVDRAKFPREKACGGGLCVHIEEFDHIVDNWDDFLESKCTRGIVYGPDGLAVDYTQETPFFYNIRRYTFDNKLVEYAVEAGATLMEGIAVKDFQVEPDKVITELRDGSTLESEVIIGAGGAFDMVARRIRADEGLPMKWADEDIATALYFEIEVGREYMDAVYGPERISMAHIKFNGLDGYGWSFSKDTVLNVGIGCPRSTIRRAVKHCAAKCLHLSSSMPYSARVLGDSLSTANASGAALCIRYASSKLSMRAASSSSKGLSARCCWLSVFNKSNCRRCCAAFISFGRLRLSIGSPVGRKCVP